ncbi:MAG TPA: histidine phosphatase family protein [Acidimicrobiales bacterium]|nr:histidine phosphatase family protein [Acidimicrobiales bacterium]
MLVLVRHGEAAGNAAGLLLGRTDSPLTDRGRAQAAALGGAVGAVGRLVTSPLGRAVDTAGALGLDVPAEVDERWVEVDYGEFEGQALGSVPAEVWARWRGDPGYRPPGGESLAEVGVRVRDACDELFARPGAGARADTDVVVVSHVSPIKAAVAWALGTGDAVAWRLYLATASITRIAWGVDGPVLQRYNETVPAPAP